MINKLHAMSVFVQVVQSMGFKRAADSLRIPKTTVSSLIQQLEADLSVKLLHRTTRQISVTAEGASYYEQCVRVLADIETIEGSLSHTRTQPSGRIRIDTSSSLAQSVIIPSLPEFIDRYPDITLQLVCGDRVTNLIEEGVDCALRFGILPDSSLIGRRLGLVKFITAASPSYLKKFGRPTHPTELSHHRCVSYFSATTGRAFSWNFVRGSERIEVPPSGTVSVSDASSYVTAGVAGLGVVHMPAFLLKSGNATDSLELLLQSWNSEPLPLYVVYPNNRHRSAKVRVLIDWMIELFAQNPEMQDGCTVL